MARYGYARVASTDQDAAIQIEALRQAGCEVIRSETKSATSRQGRTELENLIEDLIPANLELQVLVQECLPYQPT